MKRSLYLILICILLITQLSAAADGLTVTFPDAMSKEDFTVPCDFDTSLFTRDSDSFDLRLARLSLRMAVAAFRSRGYSYEESDAHLRSFLDEAGFTDYASWDYGQKPTQNTIASACAVYTLPDGTTLLAVPVSGQGYENEWMSNFAVGGGAAHTGFESSADIVFNRVLSYLDEHQMSGRVRIWVTGFSRAAAVSNLVGGKLLECGRFEENDVFVYTFGTPSTTTTPKSWPQIYNICNAFDPVPFIPFSNWGFGRNGTTLYLPAREVDPDYEEKLPAFNAALTAIAGSNVGGASNINANWLLSKVMALFYHCIPENVYYTDRYQQIIIDTYAAEGGLNGKLEYLTEHLLGNEELLSELGKRSSGALPLLTDSLYAVYSEIAGESDGSWAELLARPTELVRQHTPAVYMAWLDSTDDAEVLFGHPNGYTRLVSTGDLSLTVTNKAGQSLNDIISTFSLGQQTYHSVPLGDYIYTFTANSDTTCVVAYSEYTLDRIPDRLFSTSELHVYSGETIEIASGDEAGGIVCTLKGAEIPMYMSEGIMSLAAELSLDDRQSDSVSNLSALVISAVTVALPHAITLVLILVYLILMVLFHKLLKIENLRVPTHRFGQLCLCVIGVCAGLSAIKHLFFFREYMITGLPSFENRTALRASELLGVSFRLYELTDAIIYGMLSTLAFRAMRCRGSRIRGRRLSLLLMVSKTIECFGAIIAGSMNLYLFGRVVFFLAAAIAFVIVRDRKAERAMRLTLIEQNRRMREEKRLKRLEARKK